MAPMKVYDTVEAKKTYAILATFSGTIEKLFGNLRADYPEYISEKTFPHITLVYSFVPVFSLFRVYEKLDGVAKNTAPFSIAITGIKFFEDGRNVAYADIEIKKPVRKLHLDIFKSLEGLIKEWHTAGKFNREKFKPHITIWNKIPEAVFPDVKKRLSRFNLRYEDKVTAFSVFSKENGDWRIVRTFTLTGT